MNSFTTNNNMKRYPFFSVVVPCFNGLNYLEECLESIEAQSFKDYEVIIIDDGSTDGSSKFIDQWCSSDPVSRIPIHKENEGLLLARRDGIRRASGKYVCFIDSDDCYEPNALELIFNIASDCCIDFICFDYYRNNQTKKIVKKNSLNHSGFYTGENYKYIEESVCSGEFNNMWSKVFKRDILLKDKTNYYQFKGLMHGEDWLQLLPIVNLSSNAFYLDKALYYYRPNNYASTSSYRSNQLLDLKKVFKILFYYSDLWGLKCPRIARSAAITHLCYIAYSLSADPKIINVDSELSKIHDVAININDSSSKPMIAPLNKKMVFIAVAIYINNPYLLCFVASLVFKTRKLLLKS